MKRSFVLYLLFILAACSKGSGKDKDYDPPVLTLNTPTNNQVYTAGQNIMISGSASDNKYINQIHVVITNLATGTEYLHVHIHPNSSSFNFNQAYAAQAGITYKIDVIVDDASSNSTAKSVQVSCN
jgi:Bacterial Ig domain